MPQSKANKAPVYYQQIVMQSTMLGFLITLLFISFSDSSNVDDRSERLFDGELADIKDFPYQLAVEATLDRLHPFVLYCGATLIATSWALTAASCVSEISMENLRLRSGSSFRERGGTIHYIEKIIRHPEYNKTMRDYNLSVVKVSKPFIYSNVTQSITLAKVTPPAGASAVFSGWGRTSPTDKPPHLRQARVYIIPYQTCNYFNKRVTSYMLCTGIAARYRNVCLGDAGTPLVVNNTLVGIVAWDFPCQQYQPAVYTDVAKFHYWITSYIDESIM